MLQFSQKLKNILNEEFDPEHPDAVWCSDITYIWTFEGFVYLTSIMDLYSRKIISWVLSETLEATHVVECMKRAKRVRNVEKPVIFHCDRGCQYVSQAFQDATAGMINSYSKKAYSWDNACMELIMSGALWNYLADLDEQAQDRLQLIMKQMQEAESVTKELKTGNYWEWIRKMNSIRNRAEEIVLQELIYTY